MMEIRSLILADNTPSTRLSEYMNQELDLLERFKESEIELQTGVNGKDWDSLEESMRTMKHLSEKLIAVEENRHNAFRDLRDSVGKHEGASFYQVIVQLPFDRRETLAELYRAMKFAAVGIRAVTYCIDEHVQTINGVLHQILNELFSYRKGNIYSKEGKRQVVEYTPMVVNHHL